jgi:hypothetical protein
MSVVLVGWLLSKSEEIGVGDTEFVPWQTWAQM